MDGGDTYLLYAASDGVRTTKRTAAGVFTAGRRLSTFGLGGAVTPRGDVIATGGTWWAVWDEPVGPGGEFAQTELFQAKTYGTDLARQRITFNAVCDAGPSLARRPGGGAVLAWERNDCEVGQVSDIWIASSLNGAWTSRPLATGGNLNTEPDLFTAGAATFIAWFILDVVDQLDLAPFYRAHRDDGHGHPAYDPKLLLGPCGQTPTLPSTVSRAVCARNVLVL